MTTPEVRSTNGSSPTNNATVERVMEMAYQAAEAQADWAMNLASDKLHARAMEKDDALRTQIAAMVEALTISDEALRLFRSVMNDAGVAAIYPFTTERGIKAEDAIRIALTANQTTTPEDGK